jgi:hypothetical protein
MSLAPDATLADVFGKVTVTSSAFRGALIYLSNVLRNMKQLSAGHGEVVVRIGITGDGVDPAYRVDHAASRCLIEAFNGQAGQPFRDADGQPFTGQFHEKNWSRRQTTYEEVDKLYGKLRAKAGSP